ncbi:MAG: DUF86 domain-containing protein [Ignavibacteriales bacterium]|nr:DUF86 domain-containing protein [Ignavibacteriales bacterium]
MPEEREFVLFLQDIVDCAEKIIRYIGNKTLDEFVSDDMVVDAVVRNFEIIGEASKNIPDKIKTKYPQVAWRKTTNFRNTLIHDYFGIDYEILWEIVEQKLPQLISQIKTIITLEQK